MSSDTSGASAAIQPAKLPVKQRPYAQNNVTVTSGAPGLNVCAPSPQLFTGVIENTDTVSYGLTFISLFGAVNKITMPSGAILKVTNLHILNVQLDATQKISIFGVVTEYDSIDDYLQALKLVFVDISGVFTISQGGLPVNNRAAIQTGQLTVTTAGTPVQGPSITIPNGFSVVLATLPTNTKNISLSDTSAHAKYTGFTGNGPDILTLTNTRRYYITNLNEIWFDAQVSGEGISWSVEA